jgi:SHS2 domain-containing protein
MAAHGRRYEFLEDAPTADVGFTAWGNTLDECFQAAAETTLASTVADPASVKSSERRAAHVEHDDRELALLRFLEELIFHKDAEGLFLHATRVKVEQRDGRWTIDAMLEGEPIDPALHERTGDVKAVTVHRLCVEPIDSGWRATVVLDV